MDTPTHAPLDTASLVRLAPAIRSELYRLALVGAATPWGALQHVFVALFGDDRPRSDRLKFMTYAAPLARRLAIERADAGARIGDSDIRVQDLREWLGWLDMFDPLSARMIDLHYFAQLSTRDTAIALNLPPRTVVRDLRFAKAWLKVKLL